VALYNAGFSTTEPQAEAIRHGHRGGATLPSDAAMLVLWVDMFGVQADDLLRFRITGPDGRVLLDRENRIDRTQARRFAFSGMRRRAALWPPGLYKGELQLQRTVGTKPSTRISSVTVRIE